jgi:hypothetical protein
MGDGVWRGSRDLKTHKPCRRNRQDLWHGGGRDVRRGLPEAGMRVTVCGEGVMLWQWRERLDRPR